MSASTAASGRQTRSRMAARPLSPSAHFGCPRSQSRVAPGAVAWCVSSPPGFTCFKRLASPFWRCRCSESEGAGVQASTDNIKQSDSHGHRYRLALWRGRDVQRVRPLDDGCATRAPARRRLITDRRRNAESMTPADGHRRRSAIDPAAFGALIRRSSRSARAIHFPTRCRARADRRGSALIFSQFQRYGRDCAGVFASGQQG